MIDHVLGRPSVKFRKIQVLAVVSFWSFYLFRGHKHGPPYLRKLSRRLSSLITPWQTVVITLLYLYIARNLGKLVGLECPEPLANLYTRSYFRATWVTTALDAGFWTAMRIRRKWMRDICSIIFTVYYLIAAEQADEKVRKVRGMLTVDHLRVSWNKGTTPYLNFFTTLMRPRFMRYPPRQIRIPRPRNSDYREPVKGWLYFDGPLSQLKKHTKVVLDIPGGGFVAMDPRTNDDKLFAWAGKTGLPVLSLDYKKAPEFPYPYALNECFDVYSTIIGSRGRCLGLEGDVVPKVVITGDSAGGNLATALTLMIVESGTTETRQFLGERALPIPDGLILIYPGLDMNIANWMSDEQMSLIKDRRMRKTNRTFIRQKSMQYTMAAGTPHHSEDEDNISPPKITSPPTVTSPENIRPESITLPSPQFSTTAPTLLSPTVAKKPAAAPPTPSASHHPEPLKTRLAMSSMISYFNDRILSPEMMRAMIILYIGPHNRPDFSQDYLLSPILAPDFLLEKFPKTYFLTGERDPMVDDTVIFAGRLRRAKAAKHTREQAFDVRLQKEFDDRDVVEVALIPGISHGFLQFAGIFPEGWKYIHRCARWIEHIFATAEERDLQASLLTPGIGSSGDYLSSNSTRPHHHRRKTAESSGDEDMGLEMTMVSSKGKRKERKKKEDERRRKEQLLKEQLKEKTNGVGRWSDEEERERRRLQRRKSMVSLASEDDLLGRRMLGLAGPLTGAGGEDDEL
ncbi:alpha/beta-hydrolase [Acephala macrosclerotiorum]|nr:alpha/beta-hydrolase [Acephala macrosclerotiorum]